MIFRPSVQFLVDRHIGPNAGFAMQLGSACPWPFPLRAHSQPHPADHQRIKSEHPSNVGTTETAVPTPTTSDAESPAEDMTESRSPPALPSCHCQCTTQRTARHRLLSPINPDPGCVFFKIPPSPPLPGPVLLAGEMLAGGRITPMPRPHAAHSLASRLS